MPTSVPTSRPTLVSALCALLVTVTACSSSSTSDDGAPTTAPSDSATATPTTPAAPATPQLVADPATVNGLGGPGCSPRPRRGNEVAYFAPTATAEGDVTITSAELVGTGITELGIDGVIYDEPTDTHKSLMAAAWPVEDSDLPGGADPATRTTLAGMSVGDGQTVLPVFGFTVARAVGDAEITGLDLTYTWGDGSGSADVVFPFSVQYPDGPCNAAGT